MTAEDRRAHFGPIVIDPAGAIHVRVVLGQGEVDIDLEDDELVGQAKAFRWVAERAALERIRAMVTDDGAP